MIASWSRAVVAVVAVLGPAVFVRGAMVRHTGRLHARARRRARDGLRAARRTAFVQHELIQVAATVLSGPRARLRRPREARRLRTAVPRLGEAVGASLAGGGTLIAALHDAVDRVGAPLDIALAERLRRAEVIGLDPMLTEWAAQESDDTLRQLLVTLAVGSAHGAAIGTAVGALADSLRERGALASEVRALTAQAEASAAVLIAAPLLMCWFVVGRDPVARHFLVATPPGWLCASVGLALDSVAALWMRSIVRRATR